MKLFCKQSHKGNLFFHIFNFNPHNPPPTIHPSHAPHPSQASPKFYHLCDVKLCCIRMYIKRKSSQIFGLTALISSYFW